MDLDSAGNLLETIPEHLYRCTALRQLSLHGNSLVALPEGIEALVTLERLWLMGNRQVAGLRAWCTRRYSMMLRHPL